MRRILGGSAAFIVLTGTLLALPVYAAPAPEAEPVAPSMAAVELGSVEDPVDAAVVTTDGAVVDAGPDADVDAPPAGAPAPPSATDEVAVSGTELDGVPALTVSRPDTEPFSAVGVTWAQTDVATAVTVQLRVRTVEDGWGGWTTLEQDDVEQSTPSAAATRPEEVRSGTAPLWTGPARGIEVIVQASDGSTPEDVQVELIDPGTSAADARPGSPDITDQAHATSTMPPIYSREQWGADETLMGWEPDYAETIKAATIHHTADSNDYIAGDVPRILRSIYAYHAVSRGWGDIGYNVIVDKFGRAWEGRSGGLASTVVGAHAGGFNTATFGVALLGNYQLATPSTSVLETVSSVVAWKLALYGVDPRGTTTLTSTGGGTSRYRAGETVTLPTVFAHTDVGATSCPGQHVISRMGTIRSMVATKVTAYGPRGVEGPRTLLRNNNFSGVAEWTTARGDVGDVPLACDWDGNGTETIGIFRKGRFILFDRNSSDAQPTASFLFGDAGDTPLCGDWDGDGRDSIGVWRSGWFFLRNSNSTGPAHGAFPYGNHDAQPAAGNWNNDEFDSVAVYQQAAFFYTNSNLRPTADGVVAFGVPTDRVVAGDWTGSGVDSVGIYRNGTFHLTNSLARPRTDRTVFFGDVRDRPLTADWDGNGSATVGVNRGY